MTSRVAYQRVRNRIIEMIEWIIECESTAPDLGFDELINCWLDWVPSPFRSDRHPEPTFTREEVALIRSVSEKIDVFCDAAPSSLHDGLAVLRMSQWAEVVTASKAAHLGLMKRGRLAEES